MICRVSSACLPANFARSKLLARRRGTGVEEDCRLGPFPSWESLGYSLAAPPGLVVFAAGASSDDRDESRWLREEARWERNEER